MKSTTVLVEEWRGASTPTVTSAKHRVGFIVLLFIPKLTHMTIVSQKGASKPSVRTPQLVRVETFPDRKAANARPLSCLRDTAVWVNNRKNKIRRSLSWPSKAHPRRVKSERTACAKMFLVLVNKSAAIGVRAGVRAAKNSWWNHR